MKKSPINCRSAVWSVLSILLTWTACADAPKFTADFRTAADFEEQETTMLCWNKSYESILLPITRIVSKDDHVTIFYNENRNRKPDIEIALLNNQVNIENITLIPFKLEKDNVWIRDYGPTFMRDPDDREVIVGFKYPHLDFTDYTHFAEQFSDRMKIPFYKSHIFSAGGGREINGKGTVILVESYEKLINPDRTKEEIEREYLTLFNQKKVIWLKKGIPQDDFFEHGPVLDNIYGYGVGGHVDEFCRFVDARTILLTEIDSSDLARDPFYQVIHDRLEENYRILSNATDQDGQPFRIIRAPQASVLFSATQLDSVDIFYTPVTSYLNFVVTNQSVIIPSYYQEGDPDYVREKDEQAVEIFKRTFPTREIHTINTIRLNGNGGGLHCITFPKPGRALRANGKKRRLG